MFNFKNFLIFLFSLKTLMVVLCEDKGMYIVHLSIEYNVYQWFRETKYLYYINIQDYDVGEENVVEFSGTYKNIWEKSNIYILTTNETRDNIIKKLVIPKEIDKNQKNNIKKRLSSYVYANVFKKTSESQTFHLIMIEPYVKDYFITGSISLSKRIPNYIITKESFGFNNTITQTLEANDTVEYFYKFTFKDISVENQNIILFVQDFNIANYYDEKLNIGKFIGSRIYIIQKGSSKQKDHTIFLSLLSLRTTIIVEISLIKNDIIFLDEKERNFLPFYIENIKYDDDKYIIENYSGISTNDQNEYELNIIPLYGNYILTYYNSYNTTDLENLYKYSNGTIILSK